MLHKRILILAILLNSGATLAMPTGAIIPLRDLNISHVETPGSLNSDKLTFENIQITDMSWLISCDYNIQGDAELTAITFHPETGYYSSSEIFINDELYKNNGIFSKNGSFVWGPVKLYTPESAVLEVKNFDTTNDFTLRNCRATWTAE